MRRIWLLVIIFVLLVLVFNRGGLFWSFFPFGHNIWWTHNNFFFRTAFTVALFILVLLILKELFKANIKGEKPIDILQRRYARGEIDKEEYERIKKDLEKEERAEDK